MAVTVVPEMQPKNIITSPVQCFAGAQYVGGGNAALPSVQQNNKSLAPSGF